MADAPTSYEKAYEELEAIMNDLQEDRISVDDLQRSGVAEVVASCATGDRTDRGR